MCHAGAVVPAPRADEIGPRAAIRSPIMIARYHLPIPRLLVVECPERCPEIRVGICGSRVSSPYNTCQVTGVTAWGGERRSPRPVGPDPAPPIHLATVAVLAQPPIGSDRTYQDLWFVPVTACLHSRWLSRRRGGPAAWRRRRWRRGRQCSRVPTEGRTACSRSPRPSWGEPAGTDTSGSPGLAGSCVARRTRR